MSMICYVLGLSPVQIGALRADPSLASDLARMKQHEAHDAALAAILSRMPSEQREAAQAQRRAFEETPMQKDAEARRSAARTRLDPIGPFEQPLNLEKSWHMLHYLFTGDVLPAQSPGDALLTGQDLGDDVGYGPARLQNEKVTQDFARFLQTLDEAVLQEAVNYREMSRAGVYATPGGPGSDAEYEAELRAEVASYFPRLRNYLVKITEKQGGLLIWVS
jgi:hypothetical protein